jgi:hypothetical protein
MVTGAQRAVDKGTTIFGLRSALNSDPNRACDDEFRPLEAFSKRASLQAVFGTILGVFGWIIKTPNRPLNSAPMLRRMTSLIHPQWRNH